MTWESNNASADEWWQWGVQLQWHQVSITNLDNLTKQERMIVSACWNYPHYMLHVFWWRPRSGVWGDAGFGFFFFFSFLKGNCRFCAPMPLHEKKTHRLYWDHMMALFRQCGVNSSGKYSRKRIWNCIKWAIIFLYAFYNPHAHAHFNKREGWFQIKGPVYTWY